MEQRRREKTRQQAGARRPAAGGARHRLGWGAVVRARLPLSEAGPAGRVAGVAVALARGGPDPLQAKLPGLEGVADRQANDDDAVFVSDVGVVGVDRRIEDERTPVRAGVPFVLQLSPLKAPRADPLRTSLASASRVTRMSCGSRPGMGAASMRRSLLLYTFTGTRCSVSCMICLHLGGARVPRLVEATRKQAAFG